MERWKLVTEHEVRYDSFTGIKRDDIRHWIAPEGQGSHVALMCGYNDTQEEITRKAKLIAAAPELLEVLEFVHDRLPGETEGASRMLDKISGAIKKAKGEQ